MPSSLNVSVMESPYFLIRNVLCLFLQQSILTVWGPCRLSSMPRGEARFV